MSEIKIILGDIWTKNMIDPKRRLPISDFDNINNVYIKGELKLIINGNELPSMGYFGNDDVDIFDWVEELAKIKYELSKDTNAVYIYASLEQGAKRYHFLRKGEMVRVKVSHYGKQEKPLNGWEGIECKYQDFNKEIGEFFKELYRRLSGEIPQYIDIIWSKHGPDRWIKNQ